MNEIINTSFDAGGYGSMALIVLLDQLTRNVFRGTALAWSGDSKALEVCLEAIRNSSYKQLPLIMRAQYPSSYL